MERQNVKAYIQRASAEAVAAKIKAGYNRTARIWDASFGMYAIICGAVQMAAESQLTDCIWGLMPTDKEMASIKKACGSNKKLLKKKLRECYPFYYQESRQALNYFRETGLSYYEDWAEKQIARELGIVTAIVDRGVELLQKKLFVMQYSVKQEMDNLCMEDTQLKSKVYCIWLLYRLAFQLHRMFMSIGPREEWVEVNEETPSLGIIELARKYPHNGDSPTYDYDYQQRMEPACPKLPLQHISTINKTVNGQFCHREGGNVDICLNGILASVTSVKFISTMPYSEVIAEEGYGKEYELVNKLLPFKTGRISCTLYHLLAVHLMLEGKPLQEVVEEVHKSFQHMTEEQDMQMIVTEELCRHIVDGSLDVEAFNEYMLQSIEAGFTPADSLNFTTPRDIVKAINIVSEGVTERKKAEAEKKAKEPVQTEAERLADMLSQKFGKVKVEKAKQPKPKPQKKPKKPQPTPPPVEMPLTNPEPEPRRSHKNSKWSEYEENRLRELWGRGVSEIAASLGRTEASIKAKAWRMHITKPQEENNNKLFTK